MNYKKWSLVYFFVSFFTLLIISIINYSVDVTNVFHKKEILYNGPINERFLKIEYLENHYNLYNSYIFGSSRVGNTQPSTIEKYIQNSKFYNFWMSNANLDDIYLHIQYMLKNKYPIKNIYLQIGLQNIDNMNYKKYLHPHITNNSLILFYLKKLLSFNYDDIVIKFNIEDALNAHILFIQNGVIKFTNRDKMISDDHKQYVNIEKGFKQENKRTRSFSTKHKFERTINKIKKVCRDYNINFIVFVTPHHRTMMDEFKINDYLVFLRTISKYTNFYNFSGYNSVTTNDYNYYENSHYLQKVSKLIAAKIFNDKSINIPNDFGAYVTKENIDEHIKNLKKQIKSYDLNKK